MQTKEMNKHCHSISFVCVTARLNFNTMKTIGDEFNGGWLLSELYVEYSTWTKLKRSISKETLVG